MRLTLDGQGILITGATQGLGAAIARAAAGAGARALVLSGRDPAKIRDLVAELTATGTRVHVLPADLAAPDAPARLVAGAIEAAGTIDGLVNAAGLTTRATLTEGGMDAWEVLFAVNARAPFFLMQGVVRHLRARAAPGSIVNIASVNAACGLPELAIYSASKGALVTLTRNAANAHLADRIRVNALNMGWTDTPGERDMQARILGKGDGWLAEAAASQPLGRLLHVDEIAAQALWLLSPQSAPLTGVVYDVEQKVAAAP